MNGRRTLAKRRLLVAAITGGMLLLPRPAWPSLAPALASFSHTSLTPTARGLSATVTFDLDGGRLAATLVTEVLR